MTGCCCLKNIRKLEGGALGLLLTFLPFFFIRFYASSSFRIRLVFASLSVYFSYSTTSSTSATTKASGFSTNSSSYSATSSESLIEALIFAISARHIELTSEKAYASLRVIFYSYVIQSLQRSIDFQISFKIIMPLNRQQRIHFIR
jgi:hypothetical protein